MTEKIRFVLRRDWRMQDIYTHRKLATFLFQGMSALPGYGKVRGIGAHAPELRQATLCKTSTSGGRHVLKGKISFTKKHYKTGLNRLWYEKSSHN